MQEEGPYGASDRLDHPIWMDGSGYNKYVFQIKPPLNPLGSVVDPARPRTAPYATWSTILRRMAMRGLRSAGHVAMRGLPCTGHVVGVRPVYGVAARYLSRT